MEIIIIIIGSTALGGPWPPAWRSATIKYTQTARYKQKFTYAVK
jgi:hypothetical protein